MCGIWASFGYDVINNNAWRPKAFESAFKVARRGPDCFRIQSISAVENACIAFHQLDLSDGKGMQPLHCFQYPHLFLLCNGNIYNHKSLKENFGFSCQSENSFEIILFLYKKLGFEKTVQLLDGVFSIVLFDTKDMKMMLARDSYGVRPMFYFHDKNNQALCVCSEVKGLIGLMKFGNKDAVVHSFPPGNIMVCNISEGGKVNLKETMRFHSFDDHPLHFKYQRVELNEGGLDSSLVAAIAAQKLREKNNNQKLKTFSIGFSSSSPDIVAARKVANHIGSDHSEVIVQLDDAINVMEDVVYTTETYDVFNLRSSVALYMLSKHIREKTKTTVLMSGEGSDELAQGYLYFHNQPNPQEGDKDSRRLLRNIHLFDILRADRCTAAHGLEVRVPFLDHAFSAYYLSLPPDLRSTVDGHEKYLLRSCFDDMNLIPDEILWRTKKCLGDAIAERDNLWFETKKVQQFFEAKVTDKEMKSAESRYKHCTPTSKEALYYRRIFEQKFGQNLSHLVPYEWAPTWI